MIPSKFLAVVGSIMAIGLAGALPAVAQTPPTPETSDDEATPSAREPNTAFGRATRTDRFRARRQNEPAETVPEDFVAIAQGLVTTASGSEGCQVTEAKLMGSNAEGTTFYEAACATGPGFVVSTATPPAAIDCVALAGAAETARLADPAADPGVQCSLPANQNILDVIKGYASEAGIACTVDQGAAIAVNRYEIGCAGQDGYWIDKTPAGWVKFSCWSLAIESKTCRYTDATEAAAAWPAILAGTEASACVVQQARKLGKDAQERIVYEVKCAEGDGYLARLNAENRAEVVHPCAQAAQFITGGCTLTPAPAAAAAPAE